MEEGSFDWYSLFQVQYARWYLLLLALRSTPGPVALKGFLLNDIFQRIAALLWTTCAAPRCQLR